MSEKIELKVNDVYKFYYNEKYYKNGNDPCWCFDGQLIVKQKSNGDLYLEDTYWGSGSESKRFTLSQILERGELTFICSLDDVEKIEQRHLDYYADEDLFDLSTQHGCYKAYYKRKGAEKSPIKIKQVLIDKMQEIKSDIEFQNAELERIKEKLKRLETGDINFYI